MGLRTGVRFPSAPYFMVKENHGWHAVVFFVMKRFDFGPVMRYNYKKVVS